MRSRAWSDRAALVIPSLVASVVLLAADARADDDVASCVTRTSRAPDEVLVPLGDSPGSAVGVSILPGETLCLAGPLAHGALAPRLADPAGGDPPLVMLRLEPSAKGITLTVRSASDHEMACEAAMVTGPANLALPAPGLHVQARGTGVRSFGPNVRSLLVRGVRFFDPPPPMELTPLDERWGQVTLEPLVGIRRLGVAAFDAPLRASGYAPLPRTYVGGGFALEFSLSRWRFGLQLLYGVASAPSLVDSSSVGASVGDMSLTFGYDLLRWQGFTFYALGGLGLSALMMDTRDPHWTYVADRTQVSGDVNTVEQDAFLFGGQLGIEQLVPLGGRASPSERFALAISLRGGYEQQFSNLGWETSNGASKSVGGLPLVDLGGAWVGLGIGIGVYGSTWRPVAPATP